MSDVSREFYIADDVKKITSPSYFKKDDLKDFKVVDGKLIEPTDKVKFEDLPSVVKALNNSIDNKFSDLITNPNIVKKIGESNNPAAEEAKIKNSIYLSKILNVPFDAVYQNYDSYSTKVIGGKSSDPLSDYDIIQRAKKTGELSVELNTLGWKWLTGKATDEDIKRIDEILKTMPQDSVDFHRGFLTNLQRAFWQNWGIIREGIKYGINEGLVPGAAAGLGTVLLDTALGGPAGLALSPATFLTATAIGVSSAAGRYIAKMEAGSEFIDLMQTKYTDKNGVTHDLPLSIKKVISYTVGAINSALELSQFETLFTGNIVSKPLRAAADKVFKKIFKKAIATKALKSTVVKYAKDLAIKSVSEVSQELAQQLISDTGVLIARVANDEKIDKEYAKQLVTQYYGLAIDTFLVSSVLGAGPQALETVGGSRAHAIEVRHKIDNLVKNAIKDFNPETDTVEDLMAKITSTDEWQELKAKEQQKIKTKASSTAEAIASLQESKEPIRTKPLSELREEDLKEKIDKAWEQYKQENVVKNEAVERQIFEKKKRKELQAITPLPEDTLKEEYKSYVEEAHKIGVEPVSEEEYRNMRGENISDLKIYSMDKEQKHLAIFSEVLDNLKEQIKKTKDVPDIVNKMVANIEDSILNASENLEQGFSVNDLVLQTKDEIRVLDERINKLQAQLQNPLDNEIRKQIYGELANLRSEKFDKQMMLDNYDSLLNKAFKNYYRYDSFVRTIKDRISRLQKYIADRQGSDFVMNSEQVVTDLMNDPNFRKAVGLEPIRGATEKINVDEKTFDKYMTLAIKAGYFSGGEAKRQEMLADWILKKNRTSYERLLKDTINENINAILKTESKNVSSKRALQIESIKKLVSDFDLSKRTVNELYDLVEKATDPESATNIDDIIQSMIDLQLDTANPEMTVKNIVKLRDYVDFLRFIGKKELEELKKPQMMLEAELKDAAIEKLGEKGITAPKGSELARQDVKGFKKLANGLKVFAMMPAEWAKRIGGDKWVDLFVKDKLMSKREELINEERRASLVRNFINDIGEKPDVFFDTRVIDGKEYQVQDLMYYYLGRNNELTKEALINANGISKTFLNNVDKYLTDNEKLIAEEIADDFQNVYPRLSKAYEQLTGKRLGYQRNWVPQIRELDVTSADIDSNIANLMLLGVDVKQTGVYKSFTFERIGGQAPIRTDLYGLWRDMVPKQEHYISSARLVSVMKRVIGDDKVKQAIINKYGKSWVREIEKYIDAYASPQSLHATDFLSRMFRWVKNGTAISALTLNGPVIARMPVSIVFYPMKSGIPHFFSAVGQFIKDPRGVYEFVKERDPATIRSGTEYEFMNMKSKNDLLELKDKIIKGLVKPIEIADRLTKVIGWKAVYDSVMEDTGNEYQAIKEARYWTDLTQPTGDKTALPGIYRSHEFLSLLNLFTQQPVKIFNLLHYEITGMIKEGDYGGALLGLLGAGLSMSAMWMISNRRLPEKEEDYLEMFGGGYLSTYPIVGKALLALTRSQYPSHPSYVDIVKPLADLATKKTYQTPEGRKKLAKDFLRSLAVSTKMPYVGPYRIIKSVENSDPSYFFLGGPIGAEK